MILAQLIRKVFKILAEKVCFTFSVAFFSVFGVLATIPGLVFVWATVQHNEIHTLKSNILTYLLIMAVVAGVHYLCFGLLRAWGRHWELRPLRILNDLTEGFSVPIDIATPDLIQVAHILERLPLYNTLTAGGLTLPLIIIAMIREIPAISSWQNWLSLIIGVTISWSLYLMFTFLITEIITTETRRDARWLMAMREAWEGPSFAVSLKLKFAFIIILILISTMVSYGIMSSPLIHARFMVMLVFTAMIMAVGICLCMLVFLSIRTTLGELRQTASDLAEGQSTQLISGGVDREFIDTATNIYNAALRVIEYRDQLIKLNLDLEEKVQERTAEIKLLSITDALTGCYNRGYLIENLPKQIQHARRYQHPLAIIMCDLDHFKRVNDTYGHQAGDHVLRVFVQTIKGLYRNDLDWLARYGGEEFLIVLPETTAHGAARLAERVRSSIAHKPIQVGDAQIIITSSFGVTGFTMQTAEDKLIPDAMIHQADVNLYQAKQEGRNRVVASEL